MLPEIPLGQHGRYTYDMDSGRYKKKKEEGGGDGGKLLVHSSEINVTFYEVAISSIL